MEIFYDYKQSKWGHRHVGKKLYWGKHNAVLPFRPYTPDAITFSMKLKDGHIGPFIGILASHKGTMFAGNRKTFRNIQSELQQEGGIAFVFTVECIKKNIINGFIYDEKHDHWHKATFPYPDVVYNRIPFRKDEQTDRFHALILHLTSKKIPYFNAGFFNKWETYVTMQQDKYVRQFLPKTKQLQNQQQLKNILMDMKEVYLKPVDGKKGIRIFTLSMLTNNTIFYHDHKQTIRYNSFETLWEDLETYFNETNYVIQQKIHLQQYDKRPYDFRLLIQKLSGVWTLTGIGPRVAKPGGITTHVPKGGELLSLDEVIPPVNVDKLAELSTQIATLLERDFSPLYEFSLDIGRDINNHYWIFEANAKPMAFDEEEIEERRMRQLIQMFYEKSGFD